MFMGFWNCLCCKPGTSGSDMSYCDHWFHKGLILLFFFSFFSLFLFFFPIGVEGIWANSKETRKLLLETRFMWLSYMRWRKAFFRLPFILFIQFFFYAVSSYTKISRFPTCVFISWLMLLMFHDHDVC